MYDIIKYAAGFLFLIKRTTVFIYIGLNSKQNVILITFKNMKVNHE